MASLPVELQTWIIQECSIPTLKALRLSSKQFSQIASPMLFGEVWVGLFPDSLEKVRKIAQSHLRLLVKGLVYVNDIMEDFEDLRAWAASIHPEFMNVGGQADLQNPELDLSEEQLSIRYWQYRRFYNEQKQSLVSCGDIEALRIALRLLTRVRSLEVRPARCGQDQSKDFPASSSHTFWRNVEEATLIRPDAQAHHTEARK
ncbi:hypothetical protein MMC12_002870 [Toensbergia leucococca]|nr:hypothetical protein [Toensbergia leucococca]